MASKKRSTATSKKTPKKREPIQINIESEDVLVFVKGPSSLAMSGTKIDDQEFSGVAKPGEVPSDLPRILRMGFYATKMIHIGGGAYVILKKTSERIESERRALVEALNNKRTSQSRP